jgi:hypothetical protein
MATNESRKPTAHIPPFGLRLQPDLKIRLEDLARQNGRSLNAEIAERLAESLDRDANALAPVLLRLERDVANAEYDAQEWRLRVWMMAGAFAGLLKEQEDGSKVLPGPLHGATVDNWRALAARDYKLAESAFTEIRAAGDKLEAAQAKIAPRPVQFDLGLVLNEELAELEAYQARIGATARMKSAVSPSGVVRSDLAEDATPPSPKAKASAKAKADPNVAADVHKTWPPQI